MKYILCGNILADSTFPDFLRAAGSVHPNCCFLVAGDLINIFPEPGENLEESIYWEIYGDFSDAFEKLVHSKFTDKEAFIEPLRQIFLPTGKNTKKAKALAKERYRTLFTAWNNALKDTGCTLKFVPGNMDYPMIIATVLGNFEKISMIENEVEEIDGVRIGAVGGFPNSAHPFAGKTEISPYEMAPEEFERRVWQMAENAPDVMLTHISPHESAPLRDVLEKAGIPLAIYRSAFNYRKVPENGQTIQPGQFRGPQLVDEFGSTTGFRVGVFSSPENTAYVLDMTRSENEGMSWKMEEYTWQAPC